MKVAFQGLSGSYSEAAAASMFADDDLHTISSPKQADIISKVQSGEVDYGVLRFKHGDNEVDFRTVQAIYDADCFIVRDCTFHEAYNLAGHADATEADIKRVYAHPTIMHICRKFLEGHADIDIIAKYDSAESLADMINRGDQTEGTVTGDFAALRYGLNIVKRGIEDNKNGISRFVAVGSSQKSPEGNNPQTAVVFGLKHAPGSLFSALSVFKDRNINMNGVISQPHADGQYAILVEFAGRSGDANVADAISELKKDTTFLHMLGSYDSMEPRIP
ncbi:MAG: prephenate dehydratase domain-containing protein [Planctomycetota bacterium]